MTPADLIAAVMLHALAVTVTATVFAVPLGMALARLPARWSASLGSLVVLAALLASPALPMPPDAGRLLLEAARVLPLVALPLGWGLRRISAATLQIAASLAPPAAVIRLVGLKLAMPWLPGGLVMAFGAGLADAGLGWPAALLVAAGAWPVLVALAAPEA